jgi:hypothetical protein
MSPEANCSDRDGISRSSGVRRGMMLAALHDRPPSVEDATMSSPGRAPSVSWIAIVCSGSVRSNR